jgi:hypothetical protein
VAGLGARAGALLQYLEDAGQRAMSDIQQDLADLEQTLAVSYPLIDYFVQPTRTPGKAGQNAASDRPDSAYAFLTKVVWNNEDRQQELMRVATAVFGPLGILAFSKQQSNSATSASSQTR